MAEIIFTYEWHHEQEVIAEFDGRAFFCIGQDGVEIDSLELAALGRGDRYVSAPDALHSRIERYLLNTPAYRDSFHQAWREDLHLRRQRRQRRAMRPRRQPVPGSSSCRCISENKPKSS